MTDSYIAYYAEPLGHGRAIMRCDLVVDGQLADSYTVGSPAPLETVRKHERRTPLNTPAECLRWVRDLGESQP